MGQSLLVDHFQNDTALYKCPKCFQPISPYYRFKSVDHRTGQAIAYRKCGRCDYKEEETVTLRVKGCYSCGGCQE